MNRKARHLVGSNGTIATTNPAKERYYSDFFNTVTQDYSRKNLTQPSEDIQSSGGSVLDKLREAGWQVDPIMDPSKFANAGTPINEYQEYSKVLPEQLARQNAAKNKARQEAKKALPANATGDLIEDLTNLLYNNDYEEVKASMFTGAPVSSDNVLKQTYRDVKELDAWRIFTDPEKRAYELGWTDAEGNYHGGQLHLAMDAADRILKARASKTPDGYFKTMLGATSFNAQDGISVINAIQALQNGGEMFTAPVEGESKGPWELPKESYMRDVLPAFLTGRKEVRIQNYQGKRVRGQEFIQMADGVSRLMDINNRLDDIQDVLNEYRAALNRGEMTKELLEYQNAVLDEKHKLEAEKERLENFVDILSSYESARPKSEHVILDKDGKRFGISLSPRDWIQRLQSKLDDIGIGTDIGVHHNLNGYTQLVDTLRQLESTDYTNDPTARLKVQYLRGQIKSLLGNYNRFIQQKQAEWAKSAKEETEDLDFIKATMPTSDYFQANVQLAQRNMDMSDPRTMMIAMPQQLGSSNASLFLSLGSMGVKVAAAYLGGGAALAGGILAGSLMDIANAAWENNAETAQGYAKRVESAFHKEGIYDDVLTELRHKIPDSDSMKPEDLLRRLYNGEVELNNIKANKILAEASLGANTIYQYDMGETARGAYKESILQLAPVGPLWRATKYVRKNFLYPALGGAALGAGGAVLLTGSDDLADDIVVTSGAVALTGIAAKNAKRLANYKANMVAFATKMPRVFLNTETVAGTALSFAGRTTLNAISEGQEEGVQHVRQAEYSNGRYGPSINMGLFKPIISDMVLGTRLSYEWLTGNDAGSGYIGDPQIFAEMRGGALGALFQSTPVTVVSTAKNLRSELTANELIADMIMTDKAIQRDRIEKLKEYFKNSSHVRYQDLMNRIDRFKQINQAQNEAARQLGKEETGIADEFIEQVRNLYQEAAALEANKPLIKAYERGGIKKGSDQYREDLAIVADQVARLKESADNLTANELAIDTKLTARQAEMLKYYTDLQAIDENDEGIDQSTRARDNARYLGKIAQLLAALEIIQQYTAAEEQQRQENKPVRKSSIKLKAQQLVKILNKQLGTNINSIDELMKDHSFVDTELKDLYRQNIVLQAERDAARATVTRLFSPNTAIPTVKKLARQYNEAVKEDEQLLQRIQDDYAASMERRKKIDDYRITEDNNLYHDRYGRPSIVVRQNGKFVKYAADEIGDPVGPPQLFDKEEYYEWREMVENQPKDPIVVPRMEEEIDVPVENETEESLAPYINSAYDDIDDPKNTPISKELSDSLIDEFFQMFKNPGVIEMPGKIAKRLRGVTKNLLKGDYDKFGRSIAQRISLLHNNGYTFKWGPFGEHYAVKGSDRIKLKEREVLFGQFLQYKYGNKPVEREDYLPTYVENVAPTAITPKSAPEPQDKPLYEPNELQKQIRDVLRQKAQTDKATLVGRNGNNYFFRTDNGKVVMFTRLHSEIGSQKEDPLLSLDKKDEIHKKLVELWTDKAALKKYIEDLQKEYNEKLAKKYGEGSDTYDDNALNLSWYTTPEMLKDQNIIPALSELLKGIREESVEIIEGPWAKAGNIVDEMLRSAIGGRKLSYDDMILIADKPVFISLVMSEELFDSFVQQINQFRKWLAQNKLTPVTDRVMLHARLKNGHRVAGETDLLAIDQHGNLVIFDFKTSKFDFDESYKTARGDQKWSTERQHSRQLTGYENLINSEFEQRYPVTRRIIVPFRIGYTTQDGMFDTFTSIESQKLIELPKDDELNRQLNESVDIESVKQEFKDTKEKISVWGSNIANQYDKLSTLVQNLVESLKENMDTAEEHVNNLTDQSLPIDVENATEEVYNLGLQFEEASRKVDEEIQKLNEQEDNDDEQFKFDEKNPLDEGTLEYEEAAAGVTDEDFNPNFPSLDDDDYFAQLALNDPGDKKGRHKGRKRNPNERDLDDVAAELDEYNQLGRPGRISGLLPDDEPSGNNRGPAAPIESAAPSRPISEAPDYSNQPPVNFEAEVKERGSGGHRFFNVAHRDDVNGKLAKEAGKPDFLSKVRVVLIPEAIEKGLKGLFLSTRVTIEGITNAVRFYWAELPRAIEDEEGNIRTIDIAEKVKTKIRELMEAYPGATIVAKLSRTNGIFLFGETQKNLIDSILLTDDEKLLTLLDDRVLGVSDETSIQPVAMHGTLTALYPFTSGISTTPGIVTWMYNAYYDEDGTAHQVPIPLTHKRLSENDIDLIIDILKSARSSDLKQAFRTIKVGRRNIKSPLSDWDILNLLIRFGRVPRETNNGNNFVFDFVRDDQGGQDKTRVEISGIGEDRNKIYVVDLDNAQDVQKLKDRLKVSGFVYANSKVMLLHSLDSDVDHTQSHPFGAIAAFFKADENSKVKSIKISDSLVFDRKDVDFHEDGSYVALNGAGWAVRHGWVTTSFEGLENPRISIEDVEIDDTERRIIDEESNKPKEKKTKTTLDEPVIPTSSQAQDLAVYERLREQDNYDAATNDVPFKRQNKEATRKIDTDLATKRIQRMLGKHFPVEIKDRVLKVFEQGKAWAVGACKKDAIVLSTLAEAGTEYHETFHRVMELLFSPKMRNKLHLHYIRRYNGGQEMSEQETGERLADMFMDFINGLPIVHFTDGILQGFREIGQWVRAWRSIDDFTLALTFAYAYSGLARFNSVSAESSKNFDRIWGDAAYHTVEINGRDINVENFVNNIHLRDGIRYIAYRILRGYEIDSLDFNLSKVDIRMETLKKQSWYPELTGEGQENKSLLQKQVSEIFDHWGSFQMMVNDEFARLSIGGKIDRHDEKTEDLQGPDLSVIFTDIDGHMDEFYRYDRKLDLDTTLKIFLSTIPHLRYSTRQDLKWETNENGEFIDKNGKVTTDPTKYVRRTKTLADGTVVPVGTVDSLTIPIPGSNERRRTTVDMSTNSLGSPEFMDFDTVYSLLVTRLQSAQTVQEMIQRLIALGKDDPMFRHIARSMYLWNRNSVARHENGKEQAWIGDMMLDPEDYDYTMDEYGHKHIVYAKDAEGHHKGDIIENAYIMIDADKEALVTRMFQSFRSQRLRFTFVFAKQDPNSVNQKESRFSYINAQTNNSHDARIYPRQWFDNLRTGLTDIFEVVGSTIRIKKGSEKVFATVATELQDLVNSLSSTQKSIFSINYDGRKITLSKRNAADIDLVEAYLVSRLNKVGIDIDKPMLDYYLNETYADIESKTDRLIEMLSSRSKTSSFNSFINMLNTMQSIVDKKSYNSILTDYRKTKYSTTPSTGMYLYADNAFVKEMGTAYGRYRLATNEFMTLGPENTKMYTMAQNHSESEFTDDFNNAVVNESGEITGSQMLPDMMKFAYNFLRTSSGKAIGSIIIKHFLLKHRTNLTTETYIGAKRDDVHDGGTKYTKIAKREDYLSKATILENGGLIFPTLSDKSTWFYLMGVTLPGLHYENGTVVGSKPRFGRGGRIVFSANDDIGRYESNPVLDQLLEYAECERAAVVKAINELKTLRENERSEKNPGRKLELQKLIKNYHTNNLAAKFSFLLGIYTEDAKDTKYTYKGEKERFISFNFNKKFNTKTREYEDADLEDCLKTADKYFFNKSEEERRSLMANILLHRLDDELQWCVDMGIIEVVDNPNNVPYGQYKNKLLNYEKIDMLKTSYAGMKNKANQRMDRVRGVTTGVLESWAVVSYLLDINNKSIMSTEEVMRLYTGIPNFFKWKYGDDGILLDLHSDMVKRLGGLGSTGDTNRLDLANIPREYTVAEIKDWEIQSEIFDAYKEGFIDNEYRVMVFQQEVENLREELVGKTAEQRTERRRQLWKEIEQMDLEKIKSMASDRTKRIVEANAAAETKSFLKGINVADGTAYISPQMTLNLLRERGAYTSKVQEAFEYLMGLETGSEQLSNHKAYSTIFEALISTQKYSAFGYRMEGEVPVHYYNKFALFPLFKSMAYGFTQDLYSQMEKDGVDMVMFDSAVKSGSEGAQNFHPDTFRRSDDENDEENWNHDKDGNRTEMKPDIRNFKFNTYKQQYKFIRRQLNTDPREEERMHIGTQMLKITLSNLIMEATYMTSRGEMYGNQLRDSIMECMNELANRGENTLRDKLFTNEKVDIEKLSKFLKKELSTRGADSNTLKQLDVIEEKDEETGEVIKRFRTPLEAMSSIAWIESIIISNINKEVIDINLPGNAFYQRTPFGMEGSPIRVVSDEVLEGIEDKEGLDKMIAKAKKMFLIYSGRSLKAINNEGSMDCIVSIDYFMNYTDLIPKEYRNNYWAARNYLKKNRIIGKNAKAIMVGYRIPTQAESSVHALRVVDVLPVVRDTIVLPKDFTKITGSDFDIDKLYLTSYNMHRDEETGNITMDYDQSDTRYWQNTLLDNYMALLKDGGYIDEEGKYHKGRTLQFLHRSIDNDTSLVKTDDPTDIVAVYNRIYKNRNTQPEQPFGYQSLHTQVDIKTQFIGGKFGIGPFALANNAQILTMLYDVSFANKPGSIVNELGMLSLHDRTDKNGNSILAWLSAMINAHVDVAKDAYITELNVNTYTYGLVNMLLRTGMGDQTFMFTCQPIMVEAAKVYDMAGGTLVEDPSKSKTARQESAVQQHVQDLLGGLGEDYNLMITRILSQGKIDKAQAYDEDIRRVAQVARQLFGVEDGKYTNQFYKWDHSTNSAEAKPTIGRTILEDILTNPEVRINPEDAVSMNNMQDSPYYAIKIGDEWEPFSAKEVLLYVIAAMYAFKPYVRALEDVVKYTKIDTKKHGSSWADQMDYEELFEDLYVDDENYDPANEWFSPELNDMLNNSFLGHKTRQSINLLNDVLKESAIQYTPQFRTVSAMFRDAIKNHTDDAKTKIPKIILGYIKSLFFNDYMDRENIDPKGLFIGINSIQSRLGRIKYAIKNDEAGDYYEYGTNGIITNSLLSALESVPYERNSKQPMFVKLNKSMVDDPDMIDDIIRSWLYMLSDTEHEDIRLFARDLVVYAFLTSADNAGFTKFFRYVPYQWKEESGYNDFMIKVHNMSAESFIDTYGSNEAILEMIWNNWFDNTIVPTTEFNSRYSNNGKRFSGKTANTKSPVLRKSNIFTIMAATWKHTKGQWITSIKADKAPMFIKVRRNNALYNEESKYLLYKLVGVGKKTDGEEYMEYPIYALVRPKGMSVSATSNVFNIYEYDNDFGFEYEIDDFTYSPDNVDDTFNQSMVALQDWLLGQSGKIEKLTHSMTTDEDAEKEGINLKNVRVESNEFEEARKKGKEIKDICNLRK